MLPDRLHAVWTPPAGEADFALRWQQFKRAFSAGRAANPERSGGQLRKRESGIWQRRYWEHLVRDEEDLARHVAYVHFNPVKHGHARCVRDWPHSSFHRWVREGRLPASWGLVQAPGGGSFGE